MAVERVSWKTAQSGQKDVKRGHKGRQKRSNEVGLWRFKVDYGGFVEAALAAFSELFGPRNLSDCASHFPRFLQKPRKRPIIDVKGRQFGLFLAVPGTARSTDYSSDFWPFLPERPERSPNRMKDVAKSDVFRALIVLSDLMIPSATFLRNCAKRA